MACLNKNIIRNAVMCGVVAGLGVTLSACDQPQPPPPEMEPLQEQIRPAPPEAQERAPVAPAPEGEAPAWPTEPGE